MQPNPHVWDQILPILLGTVPWYPHLLQQILCPMSLSGEVAIVVGASRGIGAEVAVRLTAAGVTALGLLARSSPGLDVVAERCKGLRLGVQVGVLASCKRSTCSASLSAAYASALECGRASGWCRCETQGGGAGGGGRREGACRTGCVGLLAVVGQSTVVPPPPGLRATLPLAMHVTPCMLDSE